MNNQAPPELPKLWDRKTYVSAGISAALGVVLAVAVCACKGETVALGHPSAVHVSTGRTATLTAPATLAG